MKKTNEDYIDEEKTESQNARILAHLKQGGTITPMEALKLCGCFRLSARIHDLRHKYGHEIISEKVIRNGKRVAQYRLA